MRLDISTLLPYLRDYIEYKPWMLNTSPYVAFRDRTGSSFVKRGGRGMESDKKVKNHILYVKRHSGCVVCGEDEPCCLHFHHRNPGSKLFEVSRAGTRSLEEVKKEIAKCDVLCANCHAKVHAKRIVRADHYIKRDGKV